MIKSGYMIHITKGVRRKKEEHRQLESKAKGHKSSRRRWFPNVPREYYLDEHFDSYHLSHSLKHIKSRISMGAHEGSTNWMKLSP